MNNPIVKNIYSIKYHMNPFTKVWFWLLLLSILGFIITFILFETMGLTVTGEETASAWIWIVFIVSVILVIIAFILYSIDMNEYYRQLEIAEACGLLPPPCPKKKIECPLKCTETKLVECPKSCNTEQSKQALSVPETIQVQPLVPPPAEVVHRQIQLGNPELRIITPPRVIECSKPCGK